MSEDERLDVIEGMDEDGNRLLLAVLKYFFYNGEEYVLLANRAGEEAPAPEGEEPENLYVMRVVVSTGEDGEEIEDFEPVEEELANRLIPVIRARWDSPGDGA